MLTIKKEQIWNLSLKDTTKTLFNRPVYIYLENNTIYQGIIKAIEEASNPNCSTHEHLSIGFVINEEFVSISKIDHIDVFENDKRNE